MAPRKGAVALLQQSINVFASCILQYQLLLLTHKCLMPANIGFNPEIIASSMSVNALLSLEEYMIVLSLFLPLSIRMMDFSRKTSCTPVQLDNFRKYGNLEHLNMVKSMMPLEGLCGVLPLFPKLKTLILDDYEITDEELISIGKNCKHIEEIDLNATLLTDEGIITFIDLLGIQNNLRIVQLRRNADHDYGDMDFRSVNSCAKIIGYCANLHLLDYFYFDKYFYLELLDELHALEYNPLGRSEFPNLEFSFDLDDSIWVDYAFKEFCSVFPNIRKVNVLDTEQLYIVRSLTHFANLQDLSLTNTKDSILLDIWSTLGSKLTSIKLKSCTIDLLSLGKNCTKLAHLHLEKMRSLNFPDVKLVKGSGTQFPHLQFLHVGVDVVYDVDLVSRENTDLSIKYLLLHAPNLKHLSFENSHTVVVDFLSKWVFRPCRKAIETLAIKQSHLVSSRCIEALLLCGRGSQLKELSITDCLSLTELDYNHFDGLIKLNNLNVTANYQDVRIVAVGTEEVQHGDLLRELIQHLQKMQYYRTVMMHAIMMNFMEDCVCIVAKVVFNYLHRFDMDPNYIMPIHNVNSILALNRHCHEFLEAVLRVVDLFTST